MAALGAMLGRRRGAASFWPGGLAAGAALVIGVAAGGALALPSSRLVFAGVAISPVILALLGPELCISVLLLAAGGALPFVHAEDVAAGLPVWLIAMGGAAILMLASYVTRSIARAPAWPFEPSLLALASLVTLAYVVERLAASSPFDIPSLTANIAAFAVLPPIVWLWLSHVSAVEGLRRALPVVAVVLGAWCVVWIAGSTGACSGCVQAVGSHQEAKGVLGTLRLYTPGETAAGIMVLLALAWLVWRPSVWPAVLIVLGTTVVILGGSRAYYFALGGGALVILAYTFRNVGALSRLFIVSALVVVTLAVVTSPIGARAGSSYQELRLGSGTGGYRLGLLEQTRPSWSVLGVGSSRATLDAGFTADLGVPNTFLALGFVGGGLQFLLLGLGLVRGLRSRTAAGVGIAGVMALVLLSRGSLPMLEAGPSATLIGVLVGAAAALMVPRAPPHA
jgi:hypothetical protein